MIFKSLYFDLDRIVYPNEYGYNLLLKSRHFCSFIEREVLKKSKPETEGFSKWVITFTNDPDVPFINSSKVLTTQLKFDKAEFDRASKDNISLYFIDKLRLAIQRVKNSNFNLPTSDFENGIEIFTQGNFKNEWVHKKKRSLDRKIETTLMCTLTPNQFRLDIEITKDKQIFLKQNLLQLDPDPVAYHYRFKDILYDNNRVLVTSRMSKNLIELDL